MKADAVPWTREQIEAWVQKGADAIGRAGRRVMVREFPEAPDYEALRLRIKEFRCVPRAMLRDAKHAERVETERCRDFRKRCAESLSEPVEGDAP